ncbi:unnamed protein product [Peniophora sp. CBMAI 1063]|nr:unnamed protein product [Peniophora sp. CBMAI 1063]
MSHSAPPQHPQPSSSSQPNELVLSPALSKRLTSLGKVLDDLEARIKTSQHKHVELQNRYGEVAFELGRVRDPKQYADLVAELNELEARLLSSEREGTKAQEILDERMLDWRMLMAELMRDLNAGSREDERGAVERYRREHGSIGRRFRAAVKSGKGPERWI